MKVANVYQPGQQILKTIKKHKQSIDSQQQHKIFYQQYSFNHRHLTSESANQSQTYAQSQKSSKMGLHIKYASIFEELKGVEVGQVVELFLQELEEHQRTRTRWMTSDRTVKMMEEEIMELKGSLARKRESIAQLCLTESSHLNRIQELQAKMKNSYFSSQGHFKKKYSQLEQYLQEYIKSTKETQQQIYHNYKLIKSQNTRLITSMQQSDKTLFQMQQQNNIIRVKKSHLQNAVAGGQEKCGSMALLIEQLQQSCKTLKKENQFLLEEVRNTEDYKLELNQVNKSLSCQLDYIKDKVCENQHIRDDIVWKIEENQEINHKLGLEVEKLKQENAEARKEIQKIQGKLQEQTILVEKQQEEKEAIRKNNEELLSLYETARKDLEICTQTCHELNQESSQLKLQLSEMMSSYQSLHEAYDQQRQGKNQIRTELIQLAEQVRFMEQTYKKELIQNQKIKTELHKFWEKRQTVLSQHNSNSLQHSPKFMQESSSRMDKKSSARTTRTAACNQE